MFSILVIISSINFAYAINENIIFNYPSTVNYGENFIVNLTITNPSSEIYHVKIDVINSTGKSISKMYNNGTWESKGHYVYNATNISISNSTIFTLNITDRYNGAATINITLKKGDNPPTPDFGPYNITINYIPQTQNPPSNSSTNNKIYLELDYDSKIENGEEFNVKVKAYNLEDENYDIKVYLTKEDTEEIISETYINKTWKSSTYYYENATEGDGIKTKTLKLRIDSDYNNFTGDAGIKAKIRINEETSVVASFEDTIEIIEKKVSNITTLSQKTTITQNTTKDSTEEIIKLNSIKEDLKTIKAKIYLSKTEYIKEFSIYFFALFCVLILIYIMIKK